MKKLSLLTAVFITVLAYTSKSQSALDKFLSGKKKKEEPKKEIPKELTLDEIASLDSTSTFLDGQEIIKDSKGISGIYYSTIPVVVEKSLGPSTWAKKFLINYVEGEKRNIIYINSQYAYEATDRNKFAKRASFWMDDYEISIQKLGGNIATWQYDNVDNSHYRFFTHMESTDLQGNSVYGKDYLISWTNCIIEAEPGIFFLGQVYVDDVKPDKLAKNKKFKVLNVLYRSDKVKEVAKYSTNAAAWDRVAEVMKKNKEVEKQKATNSLEMPVPKTGFKDAPSTAALNRAAQAFLDKYQGGDKLDYVYVSSEWKNIYKNLGVQSQNTLVGRELSGVIVATKNGECRLDFVSIRQDNTYTTGTFNENYGTNTLYVPASSVVNTIDCAKARKYKK